MNNFFINFLSKLDDLWIGLIGLFYQAKGKGGVAVIRIDAIGDFILWLDSAQHFRSIYPRQKICLIANSTWAEIAIQLSFWDCVWSIDRVKFKKNILYRFIWMYKIRSANFDVVIQPTYSRIFIEGDSLIKASAATQRIGSIGNRSNILSNHKKLSDRWYTKLIDANPNQLHELYRNQEFINNLSGKNFPVKVPTLDIRDDHFVEQLAQPYFVIFPGASGIGKQWPLENFIKINDQIQAKYLWKCIFCGSQNEQLISNQLQSNDNKYVNLIGKTSLTNLVNIIKNAKLLISNDTSAIHIAFAMRTPAICILGGGHFGRFLPYPSELIGANQVSAYHLMDCFNCDWMCSLPHRVDGPKPCIEKVDVKSVYKLATQIVQN